MFTRKDIRSKSSRGAVLATLGAVALTSFAPLPALAGTATPVKAVSASASSDATDFSSARRRHYSRRGGGGGAAAAAAFAGIAGTIGAIAASQNRRDYYYDRGPGYYGGGPVYYGRPAYYGRPGYYGGQGYYGNGW
jgi:hypothetical protein